MDIEDYNRLGGMKKRLYDRSMQINIVKEILARQNYTVIALAKLQFYGITEDRILKTCRAIEAKGTHNLNGNTFNSWFTSRVD